MPVLVWCTNSKHTAEKKNSEEPPNLPAARTSPSQRLRQEVNALDPDFAAALFKARPRSVFAKKLVRSIQT